MTERSTVEEYEFPLSFQQTRLWLVEQLDPANPAYHVPIMLRITGDLRVARLGEAFQRIVDRHEALRTRFEPAEQVQVVLGEWAVVPTVVDLSGLTAPERERHLAGVKREIARQPFDLWSAPPVRVALVRLATDDHVLAVVLHHIACDGWSVGLLARELSTAYAALSAGTVPALPELDVQYADFALWQQNWLSGEQLRTELEHWSTVLNGAPAALDLPTDHPRPPEPTHEGGRVELTLTEGVVQGVEALAKQHGMSVFMVLLAAYVTVLGRLSGQDDIVVGTATSGRARPEVANLVGCFFDVAPLRVDLAADPTIGELLARVRQVCLEAYAHQDLPFERLVEHVRPARDLSRTPIFQVMLNFHPTPPTLRWPGLRVIPEPAQTGVAKYDLTVDAHRHTDGLILDLEYNRDVFDAATSARLLDRISLVLNWFASAPAEARLADADIMPAQEWARFAQRWGSIAPAAGDGGYGAVLAAGDALDAHRASARLARRLTDHGVRPGDLVGILLPPTPATVPVVLAVWRAGAAFVPLDPDVPDRRLAFILADAGVRVVVSDADLADRVSGSATSTLLVESVTDDDATPASVPAPAPGSGRACVRYVTGPGGKPVAVTIPHHAMRGPAAGPIGGWLTAFAMNSSTVDDSDGAVVLDSRWRPVPAGGRGELCLAVVGDVRLARPSLSAEFLVPAPFGVGTRVLRTGQRARTTAAGDVLVERSNPTPTPAMVERAAAPEMVAPRDDTEALVLRCVRRVLGHSRVGVTDDFFDNGGSSISATRLIAELAAETGVRVGMRELFRASSAAALAARLPPVGDAASSSPRLPADFVCPPTHPDAWQPRHVLLTRPETALGLALIERLLADPDTMVTGLVRSATPAGATAALRRAAADVGLDLDPFDGRLVAVAADLATVRCGLEPHRYDELAASVAAVFHDTTSPDPLAGSGDPRVATVEVIRFAAAVTGKALHYLSPLELQPEAEDGGRVPESLPAAVVAEQAPVDPAGEALVYQAACAGLPVTIIRTLPVGPDQRTGVAGSTDPLTILLTVARQAQVRPDRPDLAVPVVRADRLADAIVRLSRQPAADGQVIHLADGGTVSLAAISQFLLELGWSTRPVPVTEWLDRSRAVLPAHQFAIVEAWRWRSPQWETGRAAALLGEAPQLGALSAPDLDRALDRLAAAATTKGS